MSQPKKKVSRGRRDRRRYASNKRMAEPTLTECPVSNEPVRTHRVSMKYVREVLRAGKGKDASAST